MPSTLQMQPESALKAAWYRRDGQVHIVGARGQEVTLDEALARRLASWLQSALVPPDERYC